MSTASSPLHNIDLRSGIDIAIPLMFDGAQPVYFGAERAASSVYRAGGFVGSTRLGASCNVSTLSLTPHCNGTHTECAGHITTEAIYISQVPVVQYSRALLLTVDGTEPIRSSTLTSALDSEELINTLVLRTSPNRENKIVRNYDRTPATWLTPDAIHTIVDRGVDHLVVDLPSIDPADSSDLPAHHAFWGVHLGVVGDDGARARTITELVYVPDSVEDGIYAFCNSWPLMETDAAPSRPILYRYKA